MTPELKAEIRAEVIAVLSDLLQAATSANAPRRDAPAPVAVSVASPAEPEWGGLTSAEPPAPTQVPVSAAPMWPPGSCPRHNRDWKQGSYGPYCTAKEDDPRFANKKGYCAIYPGSMYEGRLIPKVAA